MHRGSALGPLAAAPTAGGRQPVLRSAGKSKPFAEKTPCGHRPDTGRRHTRHPLGFEGARITINGEARRTPQVALPAAPAVRVSADGFNDSTDTVEITHKRPTAERSFRLAVSAPEAGTCCSRGAPSAPVSVEIDANTQYTITYVKEGTMPRRDVLFAEKTDERISIELEPDIGAVEIVSEPSASFSSTASG